MTTSKKSNIIGVITARGGSKGIPGKNIKMLGDKPLIAYTIAVAQKSAYISRLIVSTDDVAIAAVAREWGAEVPFVRPDALAMDTTPHVSVLQHAVTAMESEPGAVPFDFVVNLQPTSPFRTIEDIDDTIEKALCLNADTAVAMCECEVHPVKIKKMIGNSVVPFILPEPDQIRRQDLEPVYKRSGAVYVIRRDVLMVQGLVYGDIIVGHRVPIERSIDIDTPRDWAVAEYMLNDLQSRGYSF